jgi:hypothetical protein
MDQKRDLGDERLTSGCSYCGGLGDTRDHVPSRVLLEPPFPENLPVVKACLTCNGGFSRDEEYFACLLEAVLAGSTDPAAIARSGVASILRRAPALRARLDAARFVDGAQVAFTVEPERIRNVVLKLARGHAIYELSQPCLDEPTDIWWRPLSQMTELQRKEYEASHVINMLGEIGSRQLQRALVLQAVLTNEAGEEQRFGALVVDWMEVQEGLYRYLAIDHDSEIAIRFVVREYLACEVRWAR